MTQWEREKEIENVPHFNTHSTQTGARESPARPSFIVSCMQTFGFEAILLVLLHSFCGRDQRIVMVSGRGHPARPRSRSVRTIFLHVAQLDAIGSTGDGRRRWREAGD